MANQTTVNRPARRSVVRALLSPVEEFIKTESASGVVLIAAAVVAFLWANSPWSGTYFALLEIPVGIGVGGWGLEKALILWVNDLLMAVFFFLIGLEIKRELLVGELAGFDKAALPVAGAVGGIVVPALIYVGFNVGGPGIAGWGVPMATDIAFALGILALLGDRVALGLKVFLLALAIVDDLCAVLVIAVFYTDDLAVMPLLLSFIVWGIALAYGRFGAARTLPFALLGVLMWYFMLKSGVHATVAGVLMAFAIPLRHDLSPAQLNDELALPTGQGGRGFEHVEVVIEHLEGVLGRAHSPLHNLEHALAPIVAFGIMPIFAFFNAGVALGADLTLVSDVSMGAFFGLLLGKPLGIAGICFVAVAVGLTRLPPGVSWSAIIGVGMLGGIGFTMSLFIGSLAFPDPALLGQAKIGVLAASVIAAIAGLGLLSWVLPKRATRAVPA